MGICKFCGEPAGFLRRTHKECTSKNSEGKDAITKLVRRLGSVSEDLSLVEEEISTISRGAYIDPETLKMAVINGWEAAVGDAFDDGILEEDEEDRLETIRKHFSLTQADLDTNNSFTRVVKGAVLREVLNGNIPERLNIDGQLPFNLQKTEKVIWVFQDVDYYEQKNRRQYVGGSQGMSIRIAKGVYYRAGAFKGRSVETTETVHIDSGLLGVSNKHIYFSGPSKSFRIRHDKVVAFDPYEDGFGLQRDAQSAKPQTFITGDGWFAYNLVANAAQL